jgi:deoxyribose-phosphate aldolase
VTPSELSEEKRGIAAVIDHTLLKPEATSSEIEQLCDEATRYSFASVCVNPCWVTLASRRLTSTQVRVCAVAGFPLGANTTAVKKNEAAIACQDGADEIDMVLNIGYIRMHDFDAAQRDIVEVADAVHAGGGLLKVILETCLLNDEQKSSACRIAVESGADFVKTSTGFSKSGATVEDVRLMRRIVGPNIGVKASGGIRTLAVLKNMLVAGATRIGASASVAIINEIEGTQSASPAGSY